ncbi:MAG: squalene--hopene cyclase [Planctomycetota bacterium]|nr:squalene--hopene cyclase [Planctomycetota bacterium]HBO51758.1 squalene--hopene cyclase [Planctomycetota bacterium]
MRNVFKTTLLLLLALSFSASSVLAEGEWEVTPASERALQKGLEWLARNQGPEGNWNSNDLGLVGMGALAFLSAGYLPGRGRYGNTVQRALDFVTRNAKPSGLLNISNAQRDMYNHGLAAFALGQAYGMTNDKALSNVLDKSLKLISNTQAEDGGWDYRARRQGRGHDLSLVVMQAKALRGAMDSGLEVSPEVVGSAIQSVRRYYKSRSGKNGLSNPKAAMLEAGQFTYSGGHGTLAMAAAGVVCLQEFGQYADWRIGKNLDVIQAAIGRDSSPGARNGKLPCEDAYTLYYVGQALYQVGGKRWRESYPRLRDYLVASQMLNSGESAQDGLWRDHKRVGGQPGDLYGTAVACFVLAMPNRYLPILQEGKIDSIASKLKTK